MPAGYDPLSHRASLVDCSNRHLFRSDTVTLQRYRLDSAKDLIKLFQWLDPYPFCITSKVYYGNGTNFLVLCSMTIRHVESAPLVILHKSPQRRSKEHPADTGSRSPRARESFSVILYLYSHALECPD